MDIPNFRNVEYKDLKKGQLIEVLNGIFEITCVDSKYFEVFKHGEFTVYNSEIQAIIRKFHLQFISASLKSDLNITRLYILFTVY